MPRRRKVKEEIHVDDQGNVFDEPVEHPPEPYDIQEPEPIGEVRAMVMSELEDRPVDLERKIEEFYNTGNRKEVLHMSMSHGGIKNFILIVFREEPR